MATKRKRTSRGISGITQDAVDAFRAGDYRRLHAALGLKPFEASPLPTHVHGLGADPDNPPSPNNPTLFAASWPRAIALQKALLKLAGPTDWA